MTNVLLSLLSAAAFAGGIALANEVPTMSADARAELAAAIDALRAHHIDRAKVDWPTVEAKAYQMANGAKSAEDVYPAIEYVIDELKEKHTFLTPANVAKDLNSSKPTSNAGVYFDQHPEGMLLIHRVAYVRITPVMGNEERDAAYAKQLQSLIRGLAESGACRFIVDLRSNGGGDMYPMINGLEALQTSGPLGYWVQVDGARTPWTGTSGLYENGTPNLKPTSLSRAPVAVLLDSGSASAAEDSAVSLVGRPNTRSFGEPTAGYLVANKPYALPDGATIAVSESATADRSGRIYQAMIVPDENTDRGQPTVDAAVAWLTHQHCSIAR